MEIIYKKFQEKICKDAWKEGHWSVGYNFPNPEYRDWDIIKAMIAILNGEMAGIFEVEIKKMLETTEGLKM